MSTNAHSKSDTNGSYYTKVQHSSSNQQKININRQPSGAGQNHQRHTGFQPYPKQKPISNRPPQPLPQPSRLQDNHINASRASTSNGRPTDNKPEQPVQKSRAMEAAHLARQIAFAAPASEYSLMKQETDHYERLSKIGQGTFGEVFKSRAKTTGELVAMKKILMESEKEGFPITALREINMLKRLRHPNVTELVDICSATEGKKGKHRVSFFLVFAFCDHDLAGIIRSSNKIDAVTIKTMLHHLFQGLAYIHSCKVLHRDMKTANILVSKEGILKLADFGLARLMINTDSKCYTNRVVTMWYRPPELLLGERSYSEEIDVWGAGCIMAEFWTRCPILQGTSEPDQLKKIVNLCGSINSTSMKKCESLPYYKNIGYSLPSCNRNIVARLGKMLTNDKAIDLLDKLLVLEPTNRLSPSEALHHEYFRVTPLPQENVKEYIKTLRGSLFEYTVNHAPKGGGRGNVGNGPRRGPPNPPPNQQVFDRVY